MEHTRTVSTSVDVFEKVLSLQLIWLFHWFGGQHILVSCYLLYCWCCTWRIWGSWLSYAHIICSILRLSLWILTFWNIGIYSFYFLFHLYFFCFFDVYGLFFLINLLICICFLIITHLFFTMLIKFFRSCYICHFGDSAALYVY